MTINNLAAYDTDLISIGRGKIYSGAIGSTPSTDVGSFENAVVSLMRRIEHTMQGDPGLAINARATQEIASITFSGLEWNNRNIADSIGYDRPGGNNLGYGGNPDFSQVALRMVHQRPDGGTIDIGFWQASGRGELTKNFQSDKAIFGDYVFDARKADTDWGGSTLQNDEHLWYLNSFNYPTPAPETTEMKHLISMTVAGDYTPDDSLVSEQADGEVHLLQSTANDEFDDSSLAAKWTTVNVNGAGTVFETTGSYLYQKAINGLTGDAVFTKASPAIHVKTSMTGDQNIEALVTIDYPGTSGSSRFGLVMKSQSDATKFYGLFFAIESGTRYVHRLNNGSWLGNVSITAGTVTLYLRVQKSGNDFTAYYKYNSGDAWTQVGGTTTNTNVGSTYDLCLVSDHHAAPTMHLHKIDYVGYVGGAVIDHFSDDSLDTNTWTAVNTTTYGYILEGTSDTLTLIAGNTNSDLHNGAVTGPHLYQSFTGDFDIKVKMSYLGLGTDYDYAGILIRDSVDLNDWMFFGYERSGAVKLWMKYTNNGTSTDLRNDSSITATPIYLRVKREGSGFYFYYNTDGSDDWILFETFFFIFSGTQINATVRVGLYYSSTVAKKGLIQFEYIRGGQYDSAVAATGWTTKINPASAVVSIDSVQIFSTGSGGTCTIEPFHGVRGSDPAGWTSAGATTITTNPQTITLNLTGDKDIRYKISQLAASTTDRGRDIDCIETTYTQ